MGEMLRETNPDLASKTGVDEVEPPKQEASPDPQDDPKDETETQTQQPEDGQKPAEEQPDDEAQGAPSEEEMTADKKKADDEAAAAQKKKDEDEEAAKKKESDDKAEAAKKAGEQAKPEDEARNARDKDMEVKLSPHTHPKTRQIIESFKSNARKARDERDAVAKEKQTIAQERDQLKQQLEEAKKTGALPKETEEELKTLRERVRELDIARDPQLEAKYDKPMAANVKSAVDLLKSFDADKVNVGTNEAPKIEVNPRWEKEFLKGGLTMKNVGPYVEKLEKAGMVDEAEQLREAVRENARLTRAKQQEIDTWKGDYDNRVKQREQLTKQQQEEENKAFATETETALKSDLAELSKTIPFLNPPPAPLPTDAEPVRKAKHAALDEYNAASKEVEKAVAAINPAGLSGEKARSAGARLNANAVQGIIFKVAVLPRLQKEAAAKDARIKELEAQIGKLKGATSISRQHATLAQSANGQQQAEIPAGASTNDAMAAFARAQGVNVGS